MQWKYPRNPNDMTCRPNPDAVNQYRVQRDSTAVPPPGWVPPRTGLPTQDVYFPERTVRKPLRARVEDFIQDCQSHGEDPEDVRRIFDEVLAGEVIDC